MVGSESDCLDIVLGNHVGEDGAYLLRLHGVLELYHEVAAAGEIDTLAQSSYGQEADADDCNGTEYGEGLLGILHEPDLGVLHEVLGNRCGEGEILQLALAEEVLIDDTCQEHSCEERAYDTYDKGRGESADGACTEVEQDDTGYD